MPEASHPQAYDCLWLISCPLLEVNQASSQYEPLGRKQLSNRWLDWMYRLPISCICPQDLSLYWGHLAIKNLQAIIGFLQEPTFQVGSRLTCSWKTGLHLPCKETKSISFHTIRSMQTHTLLKTMLNTHVKSVEWQNPEAIYVRLFLACVAKSSQKMAKMHQLDQTR